MASWRSASATRSAPATAPGPGTETNAENGKAGLAEADVDLVVRRIDEMEGSHERTDRWQHSRHAAQDLERFFDTAGHAVLDNLLGSEKSHVWTGTPQG